MSVVALWCHKDCVPCFGRGFGRGSPCEAASRSTKSDDLPDRRLLFASLAVIALQRSGGRLDFLAAADNAGTARGTGEFVLLEASATFYKVAE